jgi:hypothetical protein
MTLRDEVQVWAAAVYRVSKNSIHGPTIVRLTWSLVGLLHRRTTC